METSQLRKLVHAAAHKGARHQEILNSIQGGFSFEAGKVSRNSLLRTYERRLSKTPGEGELHEQTANLVNFLRDHPGEFLTMISIRPEGGGFQLFLADEEETEILFWMEMFSQV
ncbi:hypothetical protein ACH4A8_28315 [Streptomyces vietnamensis]|uniref:hypothetical protein n=1 Tax=Streptomyces vietnamensis TaxID=362257 RepID=UPI0037AD807C